MASAAIEGVLRSALRPKNGQIDDTVLNYMAGIVADEPWKTSNDIFDLIGPFLLDAGCASSEDECLGLCDDLCSRFAEFGLGGSKDEAQAGAKLLQAPVTLSSFYEDVRGGSNYVDPFLGLEKVQVNYNPVERASDGPKKSQRAEEERKAAVARRLAEWEEGRKPLPPPVCVHGRGEQRNQDILIDRFGINIGGRVLLDDTNLRLAFGRRYGLVGRNGIGKTTLLNFMARKEIEGFPQHLNVLHIEQEVTGGPETVLEAVLVTDTERTELLAAEQALLQSAAPDAEQLSQIYARLQEIDAASAPARASTILAGLGFTPEAQGRPTCEFSGGWRMRVALARALFAQPDVLLLDEPTNHLDLDAVIWLEDYLQGWEHTLVIVSHAREFLNNVSTDIVHFHDRKLTYYRGNYDTFEKTRAERLRQQRKAYEAQQMKIEHSQKFIDRFRFNAKRAALVQSRIKQLQKLELVEEVIDDPSLIFRFPDTEEVPPPVLQMEDVSFAYSGGGYLFQHVDFNVDSDSRIAVVGPNGAGKSTLLKLLTGELSASEGYVRRNNRLRVALFTQHHMDLLELTLSPVEQMQKLFPGNSEEVLRNHLGSFGLSGPLALQPIFTLSGGQKSRVSFAVMTWTRPHVMILDEPTNHLDLDAVNALIVALNSFNGGVIVVSHDHHLVASVCDEIWQVKDGAVRQFRGDFDEYRRSLVHN